MGSACQVWSQMGVWQCFQWLGGGDIGSHVTQRSLIPSVDIRSYSLLFSFPLQCGVQSLPSLKARCTIWVLPSNSSEEYLSPFILFFLLSEQILQIKQSHVNAYKFASISAICPDCKMRGRFFFKCSDQFCHIPWAVLFESCCLWRLETPSSSRTCTRLHPSSPSGLPNNQSLLPKPQEFF